MSITAVGPRLDLRGPRPVAPPHSLLNTPGVVVEDSGRWLNGVVLDPYPPDTPDTWDPCSTGTFRVKGDGADRDLPTFDAFTLYIASSCSMFSSNGLQEMVVEQFDAVASMGVEHGLAAGVVGLDNPYLSDGNMTALASSVAVTPGVALSYLENAIGTTGKRGLIHATPAVVSAFTRLALVGDDPADASSNLVTLNGNQIVSGDGYIGIEPAGEAAPGDGEDWIYATGPVEVRITDPVVTDLRSSLDRSDNFITYRAERSALATWDLALQVGVLVSWA